MLKNKFIKKIGFGILLFLSVLLVLAMMSFCGSKRANKTVNFFLPKTIQIKKGGESS